MTTKTFSHSDCLRLVILSLPHGNMLYTNYFQYNTIQRRVSHRKSFKPTFLSKTNKITNQQIIFRCCFVRLSVIFGIEVYKQKSGYHEEIPWDPAHADSYPGTRSPAAAAEAPH